MFPIVLFILALLFGTIHVFIKKQSTRLEVWLETLLDYIVLFNVGFAGLLGAYGHVFMADEVAKMIGWAPGSPFQFEVGMGNLAIGVAGVLSFFIRGEFLSATVVVYALYFLGAAYGHVVQESLGNFAPYNSGIFLWGGDVAIPVITFVLMILRTRAVVAK